MTQPIVDPKARLLATVARTPSATRSAARARAWLVLPSAAIVAAALYFAFDGIEHGRGRPSWFYVACALSWGAVAALSMWGALGRGASASWRARPALVAVALGTPAALLALMFALAAASPEPHVTGTLGLRCLGLTLAAAAFPLVALLRVRRESDPVHPAVTGAALGSACGASAGVMVELWCPVAAPAHVAVGHVLPVVVLIAIGTILGRRSLAVRTTRPPSD
jgi:hypothetical protein